MRILEMILGAVIVICALWIYVTWIAVAYENWLNERHEDRK